MPGLTDDQVLRLYETETRQVHSSLDHIMKIRSIVAVAFAAVLSATLFYRAGVIALGGLVFLGAWYWEYVYARYMAVYTARVEAIQVWMAANLGHVPAVQSTYAPGSGYNHRITYRILRRVDKGLALKGASSFVGTFFDLPRAILYSSMALSPIVLAAILGYPWVPPP